MGFRDLGPREQVDGEKQTGLRADCCLLKYGCKFRLATVLRKSQVEWCGHVPLES